jgi:hypothetical protein
MLKICGRPPAGIEVTAGLLENDTEPSLLNYERFIGFSLNEPDIERFLFVTKLS